MHSSRFKKASIFPAFIFATLLGISTVTHAQHRSPGMNADGNVLGGSRGGGGGGYLPTEGWAIAVNGGYETPLGYLRDTYKAGPTYGLTLIHRRNHFIFTGTVDYRTFQPKVASGPIEVEINGERVAVGEIGFSNFNGLGLYLGAAYEFMITPGSSFYAGINLGSIRSMYSYSYSSSTPGLTFDIPEMPSSSIGYVGPKLGLNFALSNKISLGTEARYSFSISKMSINSFDGTSTTEGFKSAAGNVFLTYSF